MSTTTIFEVQQELAAKLERDRARLMVARGRQQARSCSEQGPHPGAHLWGARRSKKRTSAPQMGQPSGLRTALILRSRRSWPVAPVQCARYGLYLRKKIDRVCFQCSYYFWCAPSSVGPNVGPLYLVYFTPYMQCFSFIYYCKCLQYII